MDKEVETLILVTSAPGDAVLSLVVRQKHEVVSCPSLAGDIIFHLLWWRHHLF